MDTTFGGTGFVETDQAGDEYSSAMVADPDGHLLVVGNAYPWSESDDFFLIRYSASGPLDQTFGSGGIAHSRFLAGKANLAHDVARQADGKYVVVGSDGRGRLATARFRSDGTLDASFGVGGVVLTNPAGYDAGANCVVIQPDGKIVVGGWRQAKTRIFQGLYYVLARYLAS